MLIHQAWSATPFDELSIITSNIKHFVLRVKWMALEVFALAFIAAHVGLQISCLFRDVDGEDLPNDGTVDHYIDRVGPCIRVLQAIELVFRHPQRIRQHTAGP